MRIIGLLTVALLAMVISSGALGFGPHPLPTGSDGSAIRLLEFNKSEEAEFHYMSQHFECQLCDPRADIPTPVCLVAHAATIKCIWGYLDRVNLTIPYGEPEIPVGGFQVLNTAEKSLDKEIHQTENQTTVSIPLPLILGPGQRFVFILRYWITDWPQDSGICRPFQTGFLQRVLGGGQRFEVIYRLGVFEEPVEELIVRIFLPVGYVPKTYEPGPSLDPRLSGDPVTSKVSLVWHLRTDIPRSAEFRVVFGKPSLMQSHLGMVMLGVMAPFLVGGLILVLRKVKYVSPRGVKKRMEK